MKWLIVFLYFIAIAGFGQPRPHPNGHAHNDYEHTRPLLDALENGFISIEADIYLMGGKLLVSHDRPSKSAKTLETLYLKPLDSIRIKNEGWIYQQHNEPLLLLIDIKTGGAETFPYVLNALSRYEACLATPIQKGAVRVLISGNRPIELIRSDAKHLSSIDGRPEDLGHGFSPDEMPLISENYNKIMKWNGIGTPPQEELNKLRELANKVHAENRKLRLWAIPDVKNTWSVLLAAGVDLINTDKLRELNLFLTSKDL